MFRKVFVPLVTLLMGAQVAAGAVVTTYTDKGIFNAALSSFELINFNEYTVNTNFDDATGFTGPNGLSLVGYNGAAKTLTVLKGANQYDWATGSVLRVPYYWNPNSYLQVNFGTPVTAVGFNAMTVTPTGGTFIVTFAAGLNVTPIQVVTSAAPVSLTWIGFTSDTPITSLQIKTLSAVQIGPQGLIDNFQYGNVAETPEVGTFLMIAAGLLFFRTASRRLTVAA